MPIPPEYLKDIEAMPPALRRLVEEELAAGNEIVEVGHSFPAPPVGCYVMLARPAGSRPRASSEGITFFDRNSSSYSGEFADPKRHFFVLEAPLPPPPEPDMNAIRAAASAVSHQPTPTPPTEETKPSNTVDKTAVGRFRQSMVIDYEKWHDGIGYDLEIIRNATPQELADIEELLTSKPIGDWRDVEALATIDSPRARAVLVKALKHPDHQIRTSIVDYAPHLVPEEEHTRLLVAALAEAETYSGLTRALDQVESFHPPDVIDALFRGLLKRDGGTAVHFSAMLMFLHGKAASSFDWDHRPFFLQFNTEDPAERRRCFRELCDRIGLKPDDALRRYDS
jgi:hypothetical protein